MKVGKCTADAALQADQTKWTVDTTLADENACLAKCNPLADCLSAEWTSTPLVAAFWDPAHLPSYTEEQGACRRVTDKKVDENLCFNKKQYKN